MRSSQESFESFGISYDELSPKLPRYLASRTSRMAKRTYRTGSVEGPHISDHTPISRGPALIPGNQNHPIPVYLQNMLPSSEKDMVIEHEHVKDELEMLESRAMILVGDSHHKSKQVPAPGQANPDDSKAFEELCDHYPQFRYVL